RTHSRKRTGHLNRARYVSELVNAGLPKGREPQGNGTPIARPEPGIPGRAEQVVSGRENRPQGEGGQVSRFTKKGRSAQCRTPKPYWKSSTTAAKERCPWRKSIGNCSTRRSTSSPTAKSTGTRAR